MRLSKRQQVCFAILAITLTALVVDRAFLGQGSVPAEAYASSNQAPGPPRRILGALDLPDSDSQSPTIKLVHGLETLCSEKSLDLSQARDAFSLPASWLAEVNPANRPRSEQDAVTKFTKNHQLKAVVVQGQTYCVMVDDHFLVIGQELDGFKLVAVDEDSATFEAGSKRVVLRLTNDR